MIDYPKYVIVPVPNSLGVMAPIIFDSVIDHSTFAHLNPISAGFVDTTEDEVYCFGRSESLGLDSREGEDKGHIQRMFDRQKREY